MNPITFYVILHVPLHELFCHLTKTTRGRIPKKRDEAPSASATIAADLRKPGDVPPQTPGTLAPGVSDGAGGGGGRGEASGGLID